MTTQNVTQQTSAIQTGFEGINLDELMAKALLDCQQALNNSITLNNSVSEFCNLNNVQKSQFVQQEDSMDTAMTSNRR